MTILGKKDRRKRTLKLDALFSTDDINPATIDFTKYIIQIKSEFNDNYYNSTGVIIHCKNNIIFMLVCGHDLIHFDNYGTQHFVENIWCKINTKWYHTKTGEPHPVYTIETDKWTKASYDLGILKVYTDDIDESEFNGIFPQLIPKSSIDESKNNECYIYGYPGDSDKIGQLWGMKGNFKFYIPKQTNIIRPAIYYENIDTTGGQAGAPILTNDFSILGIHTMGDDFHNKRNWGCVLTVDKIKFINDVIKKTESDIKFISKILNNSLNKTDTLLINEENEHKYDSGLHKQLKIAQHEVQVLSKKLKTQEEVHENVVNDLNGYISKLKMEHQNKINKIRSEYLSKNIRMKYENNIDDEKRDNIDRNNEIFKQYFLDKFKNKTVWYDNLVKNEFNDIDALILLEMNDLMEYKIVANKIHQKLFMNVLDEIKQQRIKFIQFLKHLDMSLKYTNILNNNGIYTFIEFNNRFKNVNQLNSIIQNMNDSIKIFNKISFNNNNNDNNEGMETPLFI